MGSRQKVSPGRESAKVVPRVPASWVCAKAGPRQHRRPPARPVESCMGESELAIRHFGNAIRLAPARCHNAHRFIGIGSAYFEAGHYDQAVRWKRQAVLEQPGIGWVNRTLAVSYARLGERISALDSLEALQRCVPDVTISQVVSAIPFTEDF